MKLWRHILFQYPLLFYRELQTRHAQSGIPANRCLVHQPSGCSQALFCRDPIQIQPLQPDTSQQDVNKFYPEHTCLCCTRQQADYINKLQVDNILGSGDVLTGRIEGDYPFEELPVAYDLSIKRGAMVIVITNQFDHDISQYSFVNGSTGTIIEYYDHRPTVRVRLARETIQVR